MASYTTNYQLHQWEASDDFLRTDFNEDFAKIDNAIKVVADASASGLANLDASKAEFVTGSYVGNGTNYAVSLGFQPKAVLICYATYGTIEIQGNSHPLVILNSNGFVCTHNSSYGSTPNTKNSPYAYLAFR